MSRSYLLLLLMPVLVTAGQVMIKRSATGIITGRGLAALFRSCFRPGIIGAGLCIATAPILYIKALGGVPLSEAFAFNSLNYILVFAAGKFLLKEKVNSCQAAGVILITAGFLLPFIMEACGA